MALYDLVRLKKSLTGTMSVKVLESELDELIRNLENIKVELPNIGSDHTTNIDTLIQAYTEIKQQLSLPITEFQQQVNKIDHEITDISHKLFANNYDLEDHFGNVDHVRQNRRLYITPEIEQTVKQRIFLHTNWRYPGLEIGCRDGEWTQFLVAADPLYIMDRLPEFLQITSERFPPEYQRRLRKYPLIDHNLLVLPQGQIGFAFSWAYFNYISMDTMHQVLRQMFQVLRPGGIFMFSYNDGDTPSGAGMAEQGGQSYMPKSLLLPLCLSLGFEVVNDAHDDSNISWLEIRRPGQLHTVKANQVMGEIKIRQGLE